MCMRSMDFGTELPVLHKIDSKGRVQKTLPREHSRLQAEDKAKK